MSDLPIVNVADIVDIVRRENYLKAGSLMSNKIVFVDSSFGSKSMQKIDTMSCVGTWTALLLEDAEGVHCSMLREGVLYK